jgi:uncharacterized protein (TIGR00730 family)
VPSRKSLASARPQPPPDPEIVELVKRYAADPGNADLIQDLLFTVTKAAKSNLDRGELKILNTALRELRYAFKVFAPYRHVRKVSVFGSARSTPDCPEYRQALAFSRSITAKGFMVITGAGGGIMAAGNEGAGAAKSFGLNIMLPFEQIPNRFIANDRKYIRFHYFFTRKITFIKETSAIALFPGGFGTLDEGFESLTLIQTGKSLPLPLVLVDRPRGTYWRTWEQYIEDHLLRRGWISEEDLGLFTITDRVDRAVEEITRFYRVYHSSRYVGDLLVIRCQQEIAEADAQRLTRGFKDILVGGEILRTRALPEEEDPAVVHLPRLVMRFNRMNFGRLRAFIDALNELA